MCRGCRKVVKSGWQVVRRKLLMMGTWLPETCWATIRREIKNTKSDIQLVFLIHIASNISFPFVVNLSLIWFSAFVSLYIWKLSNVFSILPFLVTWTILIMYSIFPILEQITFIHSTQHFFQGFPDLLQSYKQKDGETYMMKAVRTFLQLNLLILKWLFPGGKGGRCVRLTTFHHPVPLSRNLGTLTS